MHESYTSLKALRCWEGFKIKRVSVRPPVLILLSQNRTQLENTGQKASFFELFLIIKGVKGRISTRYFNARCNLIGDILHISFAKFQPS